MQETPNPLRVKGNFVNVFDSTGITVGNVRWSGFSGPIIAAALSDCDLDGLPDAFVFNWNDSGQLWKNAGDFKFIATESGILPKVGVTSTTAGPTSAAFGDLNNDGLPDLVAAYHIQSASDDTTATQEIRVFRNDGGCHFTDMSDVWGFGSRGKVKWSLISGFDLFDLNRDGRLDILVRRVMDGSAEVWAYLSQPDESWQEQGAAFFNLKAGACWSNFVSDVDNDGFLDVMMLCDGRIESTGHYFHQLPDSYPPRFEEQIFDPKLFGADAPTASLMGAATGDVDGDGLLDLYLTDIGAQHLYTHRSEMKDVAEAAGVAMPLLPDRTDSVGWSASFVDFDNDTWPDLAVARGTTDGWLVPQRMALFHNRGDGTFEDAVSLLKDETGPHDQQWMAASDLDRDGRADYWFGGQHELPVILRNQVESGNSFAVRLRGHVSNADGVGAKIIAKVGERTLVQEMYAGSGPWGYGEHRLMFGLGFAASADSLEVRWPSGFVQTVGPVAAGKELVVEEPAFLQVTSTLAEVGEPVTVLVRPAKPDGTPMGPGHTVSVTALPGGESVPVTDDGSGTYLATTTFSDVGLHAFRINIDGTRLLAHPQLLVH